MVPIKPFGFVGYTLVCRYFSLAFWVINRDESRFRLVYKHFISTLTNCKYFLNLVDIVLRNDLVLLQLMTGVN